MKKLDASDLFLIFAIVLTLVTISAVFSYTKNFSKPYTNIKVEVVK